MIIRAPSRIHMSLIDLNGSYRRVDGGIGLALADPQFVLESEQIESGIELEFADTVTDEEAIANAVKSGKIGGLGCDVYSVEPFSKEHPFYEIKDYDNVLLTPHMAWGSLDARMRLLNEVKENIKAYFDGEIRNRVDLK